MSVTLKEEIKRNKMQKIKDSSIWNFQKKIDFKNSQSCYFSVKGSDESVFFFFDSFKGWSPCAIFQTPSSDAVDSNTWKSGFDVDQIFFIFPQIFSHIFAARLRHAPFWKIIKYGKMKKKLFSICVQLVDNLPSWSFRKPEFRIPDSITITPSGN